MTEVSLDSIRLGAQRTTLRDTPLVPDERLVVMGESANVREVLGRLRARIAGAAEPGDAAAAIAEGGDQLHRLGGRARVEKVLRSLGAGPAADRVAKHFGLDATSRRTRVRDLGAEAAARSRLTLAFAVAVAAGHGWAVAYEPFSGLRGSVRAGLRTLALGACEAFGVGLVLGTNNRVDAALCAPTAIVVEADQLADSGPLGGQVAAPRSNIAAAIAGVNVFSALARGGWISIGHSQVKAATELDGKLYVTIPTSAAVLSTDEFDPAFTGDTVFEALVTGIRDSKDRVQVMLSPSDTEVGLVMTADLFDFRTPPAESGGAWGLKHAGLGATLEEQRSRVRVGTHLWVQVLTDRLHAYPVDLE